ncbi:hypothetical protein F7725_024671, partial [Dissostichus mawsoni]
MLRCGRRERLHHELSVGELNGTVVLRRLWVHVVCALYVPGVAFGDIDKLRPVTLTEMNYSKYGAKASSLRRRDVPLLFPRHLRSEGGLLSEAAAEEHADRFDRKWKRKNYLALQSYCKVSLQEREKQLTPEAQAWVPREKLPRPLTSSASAIRKLMRKAELMGISTDIFPVDTSDANASMDGRRKHKQPALTADFVNYYMERNMRMIQIQDNISEQKSLKDKLESEQEKLHVEYNKKLNTLLPKGKEAQQEGGRNNREGLQPASDTLQLYYHLGCLEPPLTRMPKKTKNSYCDEADIAMETLPDGTKRSRRQIKGPIKFIPQEMSPEPKKHQRTRGQKRKRVAIVLKVLSTCLPLHLSSSPPVSSPVFLSTRLPLHLSSPPVFLSTCLPLHLSSSPPVFLSTCLPLLPLHLSSSPPVFLSTCPLHLSSSPPVFLSTCLPLHLSSPPVFLSTCLFTCLPLHLSLHLSSSPPVFLSTCLPLHLSFSTPVSTPVFLSTCLPLHLSSSPPVFLSTCLSLHLSSLHLSSSPPVFLSTCLPLHLSSSHLSSSPPVFLSTCLPLHLSSSPPVFLSTCLPLHLSSSPPVFLSTCLPLCINFTVKLKCQTLNNKNDFSSSEYFLCCESRGRSSPPIGLETERGTQNESRDVTKHRPKDSKHRPTPNIAQRTLNPPREKSPKQTGYGWICQDCDTSSSKVSECVCGVCVLCVCVCVCVC